MRYLLQASITEETDHRLECAVNCLHARTVVLTHFGKPACPSGTSSSSWHHAEWAKQLWDETHRIPALLHESLGLWSYKGTCFLHQEHPFFHHLAPSLNIRSCAQRCSLNRQQTLTGRGCFGEGAHGHASDTFSALSQMRACTDTSVIQGTQGKGNAQLRAMLTYPSRNVCCCDHTHTSKKGADPLRHVRPKTSASLLLSGACPFRRLMSNVFEDQLLSAE